MERNKSGERVFLSSEIWMMRSCKGLLDFYCWANPAYKTGFIPISILLVSCSLAVFIIKFSEPTLISSILGTKLKWLNEDYSHLQLSQKSGGESRSLQKLSLLMLLVCGQSRCTTVSPDSWNALGLVRDIWQNVRASLIQREVLEHWTATSDLQFHEALRQLLHCAITSPLVAALALAPFLLTTLNLFYFLAFIWMFFYC